MRFNLSAVKPGTVVLSKKRSGTESKSNSLIEFPYQIYYKDKSDSAYHLLTEKDADTYNVTYKDTVNPVTYRESFTPAGGSQAYEHVFFLKPGQSAVIQMPDGTADYYIVECGVNPSVYDQVCVNGVQLRGTASGNTGRNDYKTEADTIQNRPEVIFDNHVKDGAMRTLSITKKLYDANGSDLLHYPENSTLFSFRLYLGNENADASELPLANLYSYYVKDAEGNYCRWDAANGAFVSLGIKAYGGSGGFGATLRICPARSGKTSSSRLP